MSQKSKQYIQLKNYIYKFVVFNILLIKNIFDFKILIILFFLGELRFMIY